MLRPRWLPSLHAPTVSRPISVHGKRLGRNESTNNTLLLFHFVLFIFSSSLSFHICFQTKELRVTSVPCSHSHADAAVALAGDRIEHRQYARLYIAHVPFRTRLFTYSTASFCIVLLTLSTFPIARSTSTPCGRPLLTLSPPLYLTLFFYFRLCFPISTS